MKAATDNKMTAKKYEFLEHTADVKFMAHGKTIEEAFKNSAEAVREVITKNKIEKKIRKGLGVMADDTEGLLYNFLEEIIFLFDSENFIISEVENLEIKKDGSGFSLKCDFFGDRSDAVETKSKERKYEFQEHVKAVTYNQMKIEKTKSGYNITVVLDV